MNYALLQKNLAQQIDRHVLEEASVHVPSIARGDCARLAREMFGIVANDLPLDEARAFQIALEHFGVPTEVILQSKLPRLPEPTPRRGIEFRGDLLATFDGLGREQVHPWDDVQFAAGGWVNLVRYRNQRFLEWDYSGGFTRGPGTRTVQTSNRPAAVKEEEFRLELFLSVAPYRLRFPLREGALLGVNDARLRFRQEKELLGLLQNVGAALPPGCLNLGSLAALQGNRFTYPSPAAFDEELIWRLFQSTRQS